MSISGALDFAAGKACNGLETPHNSSLRRNLGHGGFAVLPHKGLKTIVELKAHNNPALKDFPLAESFPHIRVVRPSYAYHCCQFMPSTYENLVGF